MSTKSSIKWSRPDVGPGFHLYYDVMDSFGDSRGEPPVYLQLDGVQVEVMTLENGGASVTVTIPHNIAVELGLLRPVSTTVHRGWK